MGWPPVCPLLAVIIYAAPSQMLMQYYNGEISVRVRYHVVYKRIRVWICRVGPHKFGVSSRVRLKIRRSQICPYHWYQAAQLKKRHITHLGGFFCTILKRQPIAVSKSLVQSALALSHLRNIPVKVSKFAPWRRTDGPNWKHAPR